MEKDQKETFGKTESSGATDSVVAPVASSIEQLPVADVDAAWEASSHKHYMFF